jgi:ERF superfamily protein
MSEVEVGKPNGKELAPVPQPAEPPKRSLVRKLAEVMGAVERVAKMGRNDFHKYDYVTEADLADAVRGELSKRQVFIFPNIKRCERIPLDVETMKWEGNQKVPSIRKTQLTEIDVEWTFVDGESGEERTIAVPGIGEDNVDKGFYKAFTGSEKYMLMKCFLIPTGDDPERESKDERKEVRKEQKAAQQQTVEEKLAGSKEIADNKKTGVLSLFYAFPEEFNGHFALVYGTQEMLAANKEALVHNGKWSNKLNAFKVPADKMDDLKYVFEQLKVPFKQLQSGGSKSTEVSPVNASPAAAPENA